MYMYLTHKQYKCIYWRFVFEFLILIQAAMEKVWRPSGATLAKKMSEEKGEMMLWENWKMSGCGRYLGC